MKNLILLLFLLSNISCAHNNPIFDNKEILGPWVMYSVSKAGASTPLYNNGPIISFFQNGTGYINAHIAVSGTFHWTLQKGNMKIRYDKADTSCAFQDSSYSVDFIKMDGGRKLTLEHGDKICYLIGSTQ